MEVPRKIQLTGRNTFIVSLPHSWITQRGVSKGDALYFVENSDGTLTLSLKQAGKEPKNCILNVSEGANEATMRNIVSAYVGGADRVTLRGRDIATIAEEARRLLSGVEITEERENEVVLRVLPFDNLDIDSVIGRAFNVTNSMFGLAIDACRNGTDVLTEVGRKEDDVDRLYLLVLRDLCIGGYSGKEAVFKAITAKSVEKVSDHLEDVCRSGRGIMPNPHMTALLEKASAAYTAAYKAFSSGNQEASAYEKAAKEYLAQLERVEAALKKEKNPARMLTMRSLAEKCTKVLRYSNDIMESGNDLAFANMETAPQKI
jgi:phosphate uptake regulator